MKLINEFIRKNKLLVGGTLVLLLVQFITILYIPYLVAHIVDDGIVQGRFDIVMQLGVEMVIASIIGVIVAVACSYYSSVISTKFGSDLRMTVFNKVQTLSYKDAEEYGVSALVSRITSDVVNIQQVVVMTFQMILPGPFIGIVCVVMSFMVSAEMGWIALGTVSIFMGVAVLVTILSFPYLKSIQKYLDKMMLVLRESFIGVRIIRAFDNSKYEQERTDKTFDDYADNMIKINRLFAFLTPIAYSVLGFSMVAILWFGLIHVPSGSMPIGEVTAVIEYTTLAVLTLVMAALVVVMLPRAYAALLRIQDILDINPSIQDLKSHQQVRIDDVKDNVIVFDNVSFDYDGGENYAVHDINFSCKVGETTAIIGATGSGKSTVAKMMMRLLDVSSGSIKFADKDIRDLSQEHLRDYISYVPQKAFLFSGTVRENIKFHDPSLSDNAMMAAANTAQAHDFISGLESGYDAVVARGGMNFSGGQKQRISIARALSKPSDLYIFDDSFSALDYKTDAKLRKALREEFSDKAILIIAQRVSSIMHADNIIVMDKGRIIAEGKHEDLLVNSEVYRDFARSQHILVEEV
ncbi:ABC transporter ATP-binding protein [Erysipelothrix sp. HDW6C]|uniref:ABC transporter ATP-binding protein n=1 Tax=Erysipelothrix sp. HDW6C TaxID=2714930 RepID=UPI00140D4634|nr:ABC transporter ATP-binding protein [Erysipelothrix sp. HDW6C]QIK69564.1 ABC transporter ATP-binding protein [Erysipelothrix sp. HDW6C]